MLSLIKNELFKIFHSKKAYAFGIIITLVAVIITITMKKYPDSITNLNINSVASAMLQGMLQGIFQIFSIIIIADMFTDEYRNGTLKLSMIHPISRAQYFGAKVIAVIIVTLIMAIFSMVVSYLLNFIVLGTGGGAATGEILSLVKAYVLSCIPLLGFDMIIFLIAINLSSSGVVVGLSIGLLFVFQMAGSLIKSITNYLITSYFMMFVMSAEGAELTRGLLVAASYIVVFYLFSNIVFKRKDILE